MLCLAPNANSGEVPEFSDSVLSQDWTVQVVRSTKAKLQGLTFDKELLPITLKNEKGKGKAFASLKGRFERPNFALLREDSEVVTSDESKQGAFETRVPLSLESAETKVSFQSVDSRGDLTEEIVAFRIVEWDRFQALRAVKAPPPVATEKRSSMSVSLGLTSIKYQETGIVDDSLLTSTVKASYARRFSRWELAGNAFFTPLAVLGASNGPSPKFVGVNLRFGYFFASVPAPWSFGVLGGLYYARMLGTDDRFGYKNLLYPQIYPSLRREFSAKDSGYVYFKYVPLMSGIGLSLRESEVALGMGWERKQGGGALGSWIVALDLANLNFQFDPTHEFHALSMSASLGYGW